LADPAKYFRGPLIPLMEICQSTENLLLRGHRTPGHPMKALAIKLPLDELNRLHSQAERLRCFPSALARALVIRGLDQLDQEVG